MNQVVLRTIEIKIQSFQLPFELNTNLEFQFVDQRLNLEYL